MAVQTVLFWLFLFSVSLSDAQESCAVLSIDPSCGHLEADCVTLQDGLQEVASWDPVSPPHDCVDLNLSPGEHVLSSPVAINGTNISFQLRGSGEMTTSIKCAENLTYTGNHTLLFEELEEVFFESVSFYGCDRPIRVTSSRNITISKSLFGLFSTGALDVYNCFEVKIVDTTFINNTATSQIQDAPFRGNAGGVAIGTYRNPFYRLNPSVTIRNCTFIGNVARPPPSDVILPSQLVEGNFFTGRGGGLAVFIGEGSNIDALVEDCYFGQNYAESYGGGLYFSIFTIRQSTNRTIDIKRSRFYNNIAGSGGAGLNVGYSTTLAGTVPVLVVSDCIFVGNRANYGGGAYIFPLLDNRIAVSVAFKNCTFEVNWARVSGSAVGLLSLDIFDSFNLLSPYVVEDCKFYNNTGRGAGTLDVTYSPLLMKGQNDFEGNIGPSMRGFPHTAVQLFFVAVEKSCEGRPGYEASKDMVYVVGAEVTVDGSLIFLNNDVQNFGGGALYIISYGQIVLKNGSTMNFVGNRGNLGGAIVLESRNVVNSLTRTAFNPLCFLRYDADPLAPPNEWKEVSINFSRNAAVIGPAAYMNQLDLCAWDQIDPPISIYDTTRVLRWPFVHYEDDNKNLGHPSALINDPSLFVQTPPIKLIAGDPNISIPPGFPVQIAFAMSDELDHPTSALIRISGHQIRGNSSTETPINLYSVAPGIVIFQPQSQYIMVTYGVNDSDYVQDFNITISTLSTYSVHQEPTTQNVRVTAQYCPPGYFFESTCLCNTVNNPKLIQCEADGDTFVLVPHIWTAVIENPDGNRYPKGYHCPPDYCGVIHNTSLGERTYGSRFKLSHPDIQCSCNRSGILCGSCPEGFGVSVLSNRCVTCSSVHALLLAALIVVDILISMGIVIYPKPLPVWVYPCLFYVQFLPYVSEDFPVTFSAVQKLLYYISSGLALYFPYDFCLYGAMNPLVSYLLRYLPLFTVVPTVTATLAIKHKKFQRAVWYGLWTLILLMYSHVVHTSIVILNCPTIKQQGYRWFINGDIECFKGGHLPLALLAITLLLIALLLIPLTVLITQRKLPEKFRLLNFLQSPLTEAFRDKFRWWSAIELLRRFLLLLFVIPFLGSPIVPAFVFMVFATIYLFVQPYKSLLANILEAVQSVSTLILLFIASDTAIIESLLQITSSKQLESSITEDENCPNPVRGVTRLSILLASLYYLPLLILISVTAVILLRAMYSIWKHYILREKTRDQQVNDDGTYYLVDSTTMDSTETRRASDFTTISLQLSLSGE